MVFLHSRGVRTSGAFRITRLTATRPLRRSIRIRTGSRRTSGASDSRAQTISQTASALASSQICARAGVAYVLPRERPGTLRPRICRTDALLPVSWFLRRQCAAVTVRRRHSSLARRREGVLFRIGPVFAAAELQVRSQFLERHTAIGVIGAGLQRYFGSINLIQPPERRTIMR